MGHNMGGTNFSIQPEPARGPGRIRGCRQPDDGIGPLGWRSQPGGELLVKSRQRFFQSGCIHPARMHGMDADPQRSQFPRPRPGKDHQTAFGPRICRRTVIGRFLKLQGVRLDSLGVHPPGSHIDDACGSSGAQRRQKQPGQQIGGSKDRWPGSFRFPRPSSGSG